MGICLLLHRPLVSYVPLVRYAWSWHSSTSCPCYVVNVASCIDISVPQCLTSGTSDEDMVHDPPFSVKAMVSYFANFH